MERRFLAAGEERQVAADEGTLTGYAVVWFNAEDPGTQYELWPGTYERVLPGAFDESLAAGDDVRCYLNHDPNLILGRSKAGTLTLHPFAKGLRYVCKPGNTTAGRDVLEHVRRGDISGSSFGFSILPDGEKWVRDGDHDIRVLSRLKLHDVSPVCTPAYESTTVSVRAGGPAEARAAHDQWLADRQKAERIAARLAGYARRAEKMGAK